LQTIIFTKFVIIIIRHFQVKTHKLKLNMIYTYIIKNGVILLISQQLPMIINILNHFDKVLFSVSVVLNRWVCRDQNFFLFILHVFKLLSYYDIIIALRRDGENHR